LRERSFGFPWLAASGAADPDSVTWINPPSPVASNTVLNGAGDLKTFWAWNAGLNEPLVIGA
jgi:hypothetical protein